MQIFDSMAKVNPNVYIVISNGAYLSPWWLMHIDSSWMIMAGDAAKGSNRTDELVYRDGVYYEIVKKEKTQFPICALFNHEPKKTKTGEGKDVFRKYLYMNISRGTGFIELYLKSAVLKDYDWDVLAEGLQWAEAVFPTFTRAKMHGGDPRKAEVYGYTAWNEDQGYISIHNPSKETRKYSIKLDRAFGLVPKSGKFHLSSPIAGSTKGLRKRYSYGDTIKLTLKPKEIRILNFNKTKQYWSKLKALQVRTPYTPPPPPPPIVKDHPIIGVWKYTFAGSEYTREFTTDRECILRQGKNISWKKKFKVIGDNQALVEGTYKHIIQPDGTMEIEGRYKAKKQ